VSILSNNRPCLHHVAVIVADLEQSAHLYGDILGLEADFRPDLNFEGLFFKLGGGQQLHLMKLDNPDAASQTPEHGGRYRHIALSVPDLTRIQAKLTQEGVDYSQSKSGRAAIFLYDADGNAIELVQLV